MFLPADYDKEKEERVMHPAEAGNINVPCFKHDDRLPRLSIMWIKLTRVNTVMIQIPYNYVKAIERYM